MEASSAVRQDTAASGVRTSSGGAVAVVLVGVFGAFLGFYLLFPIVPEYAARSGAGGLGAGLTTAVFMLSTVAVQPAAGRMMPAFGHRATLTAAVVLLGPPSALLWLSGRIAVIDLVALLRGAGFGIFVVAGVATVLDLMPPERRGHGAGLYGAMAGAAGILGSPAGAWLVPRVGYPPVFAAAALSPLAILVGVHTVKLPRPPRQPRGRRFPAAADPVLRRLFLIELASTVGYAAVFTFLPLVAPAGPGWAVPAAFLVQQVTATAARWLAGVWDDRRGGPRLLRPAILVMALGLSSCVRPQDPALVLLGMALFGAGFGAVQNATLTAMLDRTDTPSASVAWNLAFDGGTGIGAAGGALVLQAAGPTAMFLSAIGSILLTAAPRRRPRERGPDPERDPGPGAERGLDPGRATGRPD